jgi:hypothetical protein
MEWIQSIMDIYWEMRPCDKTQQAYKSRGLRMFDYWKFKLVEQVPSFDAIIFEFTITALA